MTASFTRRKLVLAELKENVTKKEQKIAKIFQDKSKSIEKCLEENTNLKDILHKNEISIENLRKDNEGLKAANQTLNEKIANQQVKFLEQSNSSASAKLMHTTWVVLPV